MTDVSKRGTPKTLLQAIQNGIDEFEEDEATDVDDLADEVFKHVKDFLSQKFSVASLAAADEPLEDEDVLKLFKEIIA